jgi:hypothetical protein
VHTPLNDVGRAVRSIPLPYAIIAICGSLLLSESASAALIVDAINYNGHVRNGLVTGVEAHGTSTDFPPPAAAIPLPATNPALPASLLPSKNLSMTATNTIQQFPVPGGPLYDTLIVQISASSGDVFANALDNTLTYPVQAELFLYSNSPGMKAVLNPAIIGIENFNFPFDVPLPGSYSVSGLGTQANPLHVQLGLTASQVDDQNGFVKLHLRYGEMLVPEPATIAILAWGIAFFSCNSIRRRS